MKRNPLERNMLKYLLLFDPLVQNIRSNPHGIKVYIN